VKRRMLFVAALACGCAPARYTPPRIDVRHQQPIGVEGVDRTATPASAAAPTPATGPLQLEQVLQSVLTRYPLYLSTLLERDLASGRLKQAMGSFDTNLTTRLGQLRGYYEATVAEATLEQPLATGDTVYGGYRISDGFLPDYDKNRTQDDGAFVVGARIPLFRDRGFDRRRAGVRVAEIDAELADPTIARARIDYVRAASRAWYEWIAAGRQVRIARDLLQLALDRKAGLEGAVARQLLPAIDVTDNDRLIAQREAFVVRAERRLAEAALLVSLFLRDENDTPIVPGEDRLPPPDAGDRHARVGDDADAEIATALRQRPELRRFALLADRAETDRRLADNQTQPNIDLVVEATQSLVNNPYNDRQETELFVGGELRLPLQRRDALGRREQATARIRQLQLEERLARDRIVNEVVDARSALTAAEQQLALAQRNVALARQLVEAEQRAFELGRSDLLRIQLREVQLADAETQVVEARLARDRALADHRAALGADAVGR
jgi:outer membrane protein TolC